MLVQLALQVKKKKTGRKKKEKGEMRGLDKESLDVKRFEPLTLSFLFVYIHYCIYPANDMQRALS